MLCPIGSAGGKGVDFDLKSIYNLEEIFRSFPGNVMLPEAWMSKRSARTGRKSEMAAEQAQPPTFRERLELILFLVVEILCLLLFIDFLFIGYYVK